VDDATVTDLANLVGALIVACPDGQPVVRADQLSGPAALPEDNGKALRVLTHQLTVRGVQAAPIP